MREVLLILVTLVCWGSTPIIEKIGLQNASPFAGVTIRSVAITAGLLAITFLTGKTKEVFGVSGREIALFTLSGFLAGLIGMVAYFEVLQGGETSYVVPVAATYPLVTAILGYFILGEGFSVQKLIGTVLIVSGIWLVKI